MTDPVRCPIDGATMAFAWEGQVLGRHPARYHRCPACGLVQLPAPGWLAEAYAESIADLDVMLLARNQRMCQVLSPLLRRWWPASARFIDLAGGYGVLARLLRDRGFDAWTTDRWTRNLLARGFDAPADLTADALFAIETVEHLTDPPGFLADAMARHRARTVFVCTGTYAGELPDRDWPYLAPETGQHITFFTATAMRVMAERLGLAAHRIDDRLWMLTDRRLSRSDRWLLRSARLRRWHAWWQARLRPGGSLIDRDWRAARDRARAGWTTPDHRP